MNTFPPLLAMEERSFLLKLENHIVSNLQNDKCGASV